MLLELKNTKVTPDVEYAYLCHSLMIFTQLSKCDHTLDITLLYCMSTYIANVSPSKSLRIANSSFAVDYQLAKDPRRTVALTVG